MQKNILSLETSLNQCSIAIYYKKKIDSEMKICNKNHEKNILPMLKFILIRNKMNISDFHVISFSNGPGNFTGIRIATSIAQGLSIPYNIPLIGISTLNILAEQAWRIKKIKKVIVCIKSGKHNVYWAKYMKNISNIWIKKQKELLLNIHEAYKKINTLREHWYMIGSGIMHFILIKNIFLTLIDIFEPHAQDLIPLTIYTLKQKKLKFSLKKIKLNYLNNII